MSLSRWLSCGIYYSCAGWWSPDISAPHLLLLLKEQLHNQVAGPKSASHRFCHWKVRSCDLQQRTCLWARPQFLNLRALHEFLQDFYSSFLRIKTIRKFFCLFHFKILIWRTINRLFQLLNKGRKGLRIAKFCSTLFHDWSFNIAHSILAANHMQSYSKSWLDYFCLFRYLSRAC